MTEPEVIKSGRRRLGYDAQVLMALYGYSRVFETNRHNTNGKRDRGASQERGSEVS